MINFLGIDVDKIDGYNVRKINDKHTTVLSENNMGACKMNEPQTDEFISRKPEKKDNLNAMNNIAENPALFEKETTYNPKTGSITTKRKGMIDGNIEVIKTNGSKWIYDGWGKNKQIAPAGTYSDLIAKAKTDYENNK